MKKILIIITLSLFAFQTSCNKDENNEGDGSGERTLENLQSVTLDRIVFSQYRKSPNGTWDPNLQNTERYPDVYLQISVDNIILYETSVMMNFPSPREYDINGNIIRNGPDVEFVPTNGLVLDKELAYGNRYSFKILDEDDGDDDVMFDSGWGTTSVTDGSHPIPFQNTIIFDNYSRYWPDHLDEVTSVEFYFTHIFN